MFVFVYSPYQIKLLQNLQIVLDNQKNPYLNPATPRPPLPQKNSMCQIFPPQKFRNQKFQTPKNPSIIPIAGNLGYLPVLQGFIK